MKKRRTADEVARLLRDVDRDLAKGLTVSDACRKIGIGETRSDNGSEFICEALTGGLRGAGTEPIPVAAGRTWENGYLESFHSRLRDEFLERDEFEWVSDARAKEGWF